VDDTILRLDHATGAAMSIEDEEDRRIRDRIAELAPSASESDQTHRMALELVFELRDVTRRLQRVERAIDAQADERERGRSRLSIPITERTLVLAGIVAAVVAGQFDLGDLLGFLAPSPSE
jgi:hypothetical protein